MNRQKSESESSVCLCENTQQRVQGWGWEVEECPLGPKSD